MILPLETLLAYGRCPLRARYRLWGAPERTLTLREAILEGVKDGIAAFLGSAASGRTKGGAIKNALAAYQARLSTLDRAKLLGAEFGFMSEFNRGLAILNSFVSSLAPKRDAVVHGRIPAEVVIDEDLVQGDVLGLVSLNDSEPSERIFSVVLAGWEEKVPSTWDRLQQGFSYHFLRQSLGKEFHKGNQSGLLVVEMNSGKTKRRGVTADEDKVFVALARATIAGVKANVFPPQPSRLVCHECPYERACQLRYADPLVSDYSRRQFLERHGGV